jgi:hypothetical protein
LEAVKALEALNGLENRKVSRRLDSTVRNLVTERSISSQYALNSTAWNAQWHYHADIQHPVDTPNRSASFFGRHQPCLGDRRLELCHSHAAVELAVSGFGVGGIWNRQLVLFLRGILHRSLLSSEPQKVDHSRIADGGSSFKPAQSSAPAKLEHPDGLYRVS